MDKDEKIHLIGIGGSGLSAIALVLLESGFTVSGSDRVDSPYLNLLEKKGARVFIGHHPRNVEEAGLVVRSSAVPDDNIEVLAARQAGIPVLKRADFLGQLMKGSQGIAVAGTHGKTTTTAMISWMLYQLDQDPTFIVGSTIKGLETNARAGAGPAFVIEADEYDGMFLGLQPQIAVLTNMEYDHPDCYPNPEAYRQVFLRFTSQIMPNGILIYSGGDRGASGIAAEVQSATCLSYGTSASFDYQAHHIQLNDTGGCDFEFTFSKENQGTAPALIKAGLRIPGEHNVLNALAALAVAHQLDLPLNEAAKALKSFPGTGRRFEIIGEVNGVTVIDDYAHHPTEIRATLQAARAKYPGQRLWVVWQPHTFSRTRSLFAEFSSAFSEADRLLVLDIFAAREAQPEDGFSSQHYVEASQHPAVQYVSGFSEASRLLLKNLASGDVLLVLSAGDADRVSAEVAQALKERSKADE